MLHKVNLAEKLVLIREPWKPHVVGEVNDALVKLVRFRGEFLWHHHDNEDELFLVVTAPSRCAAPSHSSRCGEASRAISSASMSPSRTDVDSGVRTS